MRAREPDEQGYVERDGVRVAYESFGDAATTVLFPPVDTIVDSRVWKGQVPYLSRHFRVVTVDPRGNGRSDRPTDPAAYDDTELIADALAVMDHLGIERAVLVGVCYSAWLALVDRRAAPGPGAAAWWRSRPGCWTTTPPLAPGRTRGPVRRGAAVATTGGTATTATTGSRAGRTSWSSSSASSARSRTPPRCSRTSSPTRWAPRAR